MALQVARVSDVISHGGEIVGGSPDTYADGLKVARLGDAVECAIHGSQVITTASTVVTADDKGVARLGDHISCGAVITSASPDVYSG